MLPPTTALAPIKTIATHPTESLQKALVYLRFIYNPPVHGSRRRKSQSKAKAAPSALEALRTDAFERAYAIKWLTAVVAQCEMLEEEEERAKREALVEDAASLLATCAGTASAGMISRHFVFDFTDSSTPSTSAPQVPLTVDLTDVPLDNQDYGSVGAQTWGGACILAEMIAESPEAFGLPRSNDPHSASRGPLRCLELGAGTGLVSLIVGKLIERLSSRPDFANMTVDIVATDYYPSVLANLEQNIRSNFPPTSIDTSTINNKRRIRSHRLDWSTFFDAEIHEPVFQAPFDVVYGADIVYESLHATWIKGCLEKLLRKPSGHSDPTFHLIIPLRATHAVESGTIEKVFGTERKDSSERAGQGAELVIKHKEIIICDAESSKDGKEVEYAYYKIGWGWA